MSIIQTIFSPLLALDRRNFLGMSPLPPPALATAADLYDLLEAYYQNNALYERVQEQAAESGVKHPAIKGLYNPAFRCVEFYPSKLWPGSLPDALQVKTNNQAIIAPIAQIWRWSNWANKKQLAARYLAEYGDLFIKVVQRGAIPGAGESVTREASATDPDGTTVTVAQNPDPEQGTVTDVRQRRVFFEVLKPRYVTELQEDERDFVVHARIDVPVPNPNARPAGLSESPFAFRDSVPWTHTEVWNKARGDCRIWVHDKAPGTPVEKLGTPQTVIAFRAMGIDFVPIVHAKFRDVGEVRGVGAFTLALDKIDELNAEVTRLHQMLFRYGKPLWAVESNMVDATHRPLPAPRFENEPGTGGFGPQTDSSNTEVWVGDEPMAYLPGMARLNPLIANVPYDPHLKAIEGQQHDLEGDLPELIFFRVLAQFSDPSGRSLQYLLSPAIDRALEVRGNAETALVRANQIALTLGKAAGIWGNAIGDFDATDPTRNFEHTFAARPIITMSDADLAETQRTRSEAHERMHNLGVPKHRLWLEMGYDEDEIAQNEAWQREEDQAALDKQQRQMELAASLSQPEPSNQQPAGTSGRGAGRPQTNAATAQPGLTGSRSAPGAQQRGSPNISAANQ